MKKLQKKIKISSCVFITYQYDVRVYKKCMHTSVPHQANERQKHEQTGRTSGMNLPDAIKARDDDRNVHNELPRYSTLK